MWLTILLLLVFVAVLSVVLLTFLFLGSGRRLEMPMQWTNRTMAFNSAEQSAMQSQDAFSANLCVGGENVSSDNITIADNEYAALMSLDDKEVIRAAIKEAIASSDIVAVSGGSSQGKQDFTERIFDECSEGGVFTHGLALRPGKPPILGYDKTNKTVLAGLPGHPAAAVVVFDLLVLGTLKKMMRVPAKSKIMARMEFNVAGGGRSICQMVKLIPQEGDYDIARPLLGKSGLMTVLASADGYVMIDSEKEGLKKGEAVEVTPL